MRAAAAALASGAAAAVLAIALRRRRKGDPFDERIDAILAFWFGGHTFCARAELGRKLWFARGSDRDAADDSVRRCFAEMVREAREGALDAWRRTPRGALALIVALDQLARHVDREGDHTETSQRAADIYREDFGGRWDPCSTLSPAQHAFCLLSVRHAANDSVEACEAVEALILGRQAHDQGEAEVLDKLRRATARRRRERTEPPGGAPGGAYEDAELLDARCTAGGASSKSAVHQVLQAFAATEKTCAVSLSGGVDSMVMLWGLSTLMEVSALHINYGNRPEAEAEAAFLERWCASINVPLKVLAMPASLRRGVTDRELYEKEARERRFAFYREADAPILLAHHRGDVMENCVSNSLKGCGPLRLSGMVQRDTLHGVDIVRPFLALDKAQILRVAFDEGVPFLRDSTPAWSTRGRLRNEVLPLLKDVYGHGCVDSLAQLAEDSDSLRALCDARVFAAARSEVRKWALGTRINLLPFRDESPFFWRQLLGDVAESIGRGRMSRKALRLLVGRLKGARGVASIPSKDVRPVQGWLELKKGWISYLDEGGALYLFDDAVFDAAPPYGAPVEWGMSRFGHWTVDTSWAESDPGYDDTAELAPFFATGRFVYYVQCDGALVLAPAAGLRKCRPLQRLDALTRSPRLRAAVPVPVRPALDVHVPAATNDKRWVRVVVSYG